MADTKGAELNQLSRLVFDSAAKWWQFSIVGELTAGLIGLVVAIAQPSLAASTAWAIIAAFIFIVAFCCRVAFERRYDVAETMRRQSVLSEGLGWPISEAQFREWRSRAGKRILDAFNIQQRSDGYYASAAQQGPRRLAEMTLESAFWTRHLYQMLFRTVLIVLVPIAFLLLFLITCTVFVDWGQATRVVYAVYLAIPIIISVDFVGLALRSKRFISDLRDIEQSIETLCGISQLQLAEVMRLVAEYNCVVSQGIVIPRWFYTLFRKRIEQYWNPKSLANTKEQGDIHN